VGVEAEEEVAAFIDLPVAPLVPLFEVPLLHCIQFLHEAQVTGTEHGPPDECLVGFTIAEVGIVEVGIVEIGIAQVSIAEIGMGEIGRAQVGTMQIDKLEVGRAQVGFAEIRLDVLMLLSPGVPGSYALVKKVEMLLICHHVLLACSVLIINKRSLMCKSRFLGVSLFREPHGAAFSPAKAKRPLAPIWD
jgi:hypothetical protein